MKRFSIGRVAAVMSTAALAAAFGLPSAAAADSTTLPDNVTLQVLQPTPHEVVTTPTLAIQVNAVGYRVDARYAGTPDSSFVGHYHEILDGMLVDMSPMQDGERDAMSMVGVSVGPHVLTLIPANNDHTMVMAGAVSVPFTYAGAYLSPPAPVEYPNAPSITITSPANNATVSGSFFYMTADVSNFNLSQDAFGKGNIEGCGHWHIFLDQPMMANMLTMAGSNTQMVSLKGVTPGWHTFWAVLVNNMHMPFMGEPTTMTSVTLFVQSSG